jgi:hypothetical protein
MMNAIARRRAKWTTDGSEEEDKGGNHGEKK